MTGPVLAHLGVTKLELGPADTPEPGRHWRLARDADNIAWLVLDRHDAGANSLSGDVMAELSDRLAEIERDPPEGLVIRSAKTAGFVAGADIGEFRGLDDSLRVMERLEQGHAILDRLEDLSCPTVAVVHGYGLGGGFELALACDHRIAVDGAHFGFPEVRLGLHPGLGGTFRLTELIDPIEAMTMMLTGRPAYARKARSLGIVDAVTEERHVRNAVKAAIAGKLDKNGRSGGSKGVKAWAMGIGPARKLAARQMRGTVARKASQQHYPAPYALIDLWEAHGDNRKDMQRGEIASFAKLLVGSTAQNLIRVFFLREHLKSLAVGDPDIAHVHVIGAGAMGGEIAAWCALQGFTVSLADLDLKPLARAVRRAGRIFDARHLRGIDKRDAFDRLIPDPKGAGLAKADLVIEAVSEKPDVKRKIYAAVEPGMKSGAILATNTSSLELGDLAAGLTHPGRFAGLHFFNPVSKLELVEVVSHPGVEQAVLDRLTAFTGAIGRLPAPVRSAPGFLVNRALTPYLLEAVLMIDEGIDKETIDREAERFGMPMGPVEVADQVGLDICLDVADSLKHALDRPLPAIPDWFRAKVANGELGAKSGKGFYTWTDGKAQRSPDTAVPQSDLRDRLILPMLNACVECLRTGVVADEETVDGAMIFATGFAPFRGGPMHYARHRGIADVVKALEALAANHGPRFEPDEGWAGLA